MASNHQGGNIQPGLDLEEHDGDINAKRVSLASAATIFVVSNVGSAQLSGSVTVGSLVSAATIYAVVNTSAAGVGESMVTLFPSPNFIGITTVANKDRTITGNITISDSKAFIGLTTSVIGSAIPAGANFIGLVTVVGSLSPAAGNVTLDAGSKTGIVGNVTLSDSKGFIGLTTVVQASSARTITGNLTLSDAKTFIGLTTTVVGSALPAGANFIGLVTVTGSLSAAAGNVTLDAGSKTGIVGNVTLSDSKTFIGLVTVVQSSAARTITGNLTLSDSKAFIGLVTAVPSTTVRSISGNVTLSDAKTYIGLVTATIGGTPNVAVVGNVTLSDSKGFIGLVTSIPAFMSDTTIFSFIASNASHTTIFTPPSNQRWYLKNLILGSAGNVRAEIRSGATQFVPYISLATSGGYVLGPDQAGIPSRANNDAFVVGLQSAVTVSGMANVYFKAG